MGDPSSSSILSKRFKSTAIQIIASRVGYRDNCYTEVEIANNGIDITWAHPIRKIASIGVSNEIQRDRAIARSSPLNLEFPSTKLLPLAASS